MADCQKIQSTDNSPVNRIEAVVPSFWWGLPFLLAAFIQGLPIAGGLQVQGERWAETIYESTQARASTMGYENTIVLALFWGTLYFLSICMVWRVLRPATLLRIWPFLLVLIVMMANFFWSPYPGKVAVNIVHNIGVFAIAYAAAYRYRQDPKMLLTHLGMVLGVNLVLQTIGVIYLPAIAIQLDGRWCGLSGNANVLGSIGFIALWANCAALGFTQKTIFSIHLVFCLLAVIVLVETQSMTSILCSLLAVGGTYVFKLYNQNSPHRSIRSGWLSLVFLAAAIIILMAYTTERSDWSASIGRSSDLSGRQSIWLSAVDLISNEPLIGYGFDDNAYANQVSGMVHSTYHNGFLDLAVRGGLLSLFFLLLLFINWYRRLGRTMDLPVSFVTCFLPFVLASIFYNMTEVTFFAARNILWITLLVIIITPEIPLSQQLQEYQRKVRSCLV